MVQQEAIGRALTNYLEAIKPLGVVDEIIVGTIPGQPAQVFNVTKTDFSRKQVEDPRYRELARFGTQLEDMLDSVIPTFVSNVNPSQLEGFLQDASNRGFELKRLPVAVEILP